MSFSSTFGDRVEMVARRLRGVCAGTLMAGKSAGCGNPLSLGDMWPKNELLWSARGDRPGESGASGSLQKISFAASTRRGKREEERDALSPCTWELEREMGGESGNIGGGVIVLDAKAKLWRVSSTTPRNRSHEF